MVFVKFPNNKFKGIVLDLLLIYFFIIIIISQTTDSFFSDLPFANHSNERRDLFNLHFESWRKKWDRFFAMFWNDAKIQLMIDTRNPFDSKVQSEEDGFKFITLAIAENFYDKVLGGEKILCNVQFVDDSSPNKTTYRRDVKLISVEGIWLNLSINISI